MTMTAPMLAVALAIGLGLMAGPPDVLAQGYDPCYRPSDNGYQPDYGSATCNQPSGGGGGGWVMGTDIRSSEHGSR